MSNREGYKGLYIAIFKQAIKDDLKKEPERMHNEIMQEIHVSEKDRPNLIKQLKKAFETHKKELRISIRNRVYREAQSWPERANDKIYQSKYEEIKHKIMEDVRIGLGGV